MKRLIIITMTVLALASGLQAATNSETETLFNKNEVGVTLQGSYATQGSEKWGADFGAFATPFNKYVGVESTVGFSDVTTGATVDDVKLNGVIRIPFDKYRIALSAVGGARYDLSEKDYQWGVGPRLSYRFNPKWELFGGYKYTFARQNLPERKGFNFGVSMNF